MKQHHRFTTALSIDKNKVAVIWGVNAGMTDNELIGQTYGDCPQGDGWYFSDGGALQIVLCPQTCAMIHTDMNPKLCIYVACALCGACIN